MDMFWMVWNENGRSPTYRHPSFAQAREEAMRLARGNPGDKFFVLQAAGFVVKTDVTWCPLGSADDDGIPF